jgi:hypothetical protein
MHGKLLQSYEKSRAEQKRNPSFLCRDAVTSTKLSAKLRKVESRTKKKSLFFLCRDAVTSTELTKAREKKKKNNDFSICYIDCDVTPAKTMPIKT